MTVKNNELKFAIFTTHPKYNIARRCFRPPLEPARRRTIRPPSTGVARIDLVILSCYEGVNFERTEIREVQFVGEGSSLLLGDANLDGLVNLLDVAPFVDLLSEGEYLPTADLNCDGAVNLLDVAPFVDVLAGG